MQDGVRRLLESQESTKRVGRDLVDALNQLKRVVQNRLVDNLDEPAERRELAIGRRILEIAAGGHDEHSEELRRLGQELVDIHGPGGAEATGVEGQPMVVSTISADGPTS